MHQEFHATYKRVDVRAEGAGAFTPLNSAAKQSGFSVCVRTDFGILSVCEWEGSAAFRLLSLMKNPHLEGFVKGHEFTRADKANQITRASALAISRMHRINFVGSLSSLQAAEFKANHESDFSLGPFAIDLYAFAPSSHADTSASA